MAPFNIRVNAILPGSVRTEDYEDASGGGDEYFEEMAKNQPLKRLGKEEDFGAAAVYLASDASSWITGHLLMVSGGAVAASLCERAVAGYRTRLTPRRFPHA